MAHKLEAEFQERAREHGQPKTLVDSLPGSFYLFDRDGRFLQNDDKDQSGLVMLRTAVAAKGASALLCNYHKNSDLF